MGLVNAVADTAAPLHSVILAGTVTVGVGFTVIENDAGVPRQLFAVEFTVILAVMGLEVVFTALKPAMFPEPLPARPMAVLLLVQE